ncbi:hypothetical protein [Candidatus Neptunochlamydia vexilliferae]|uniref:Secreted protein n=1 Tax=Candidatus Neptunichlamydia vexilliferae TaxID=1651774 RepID=A0ABS0AYN5_9BACT|nr:hypothetical protein [Candidatus Neptunochlamydia vexilliferae]MBF5059239.1 hypothetical protein [Candidatus Neptunochlamydia vexilliferae]
MKKLLILFSLSFCFTASNLSATEEAQTTETETNQQEETSEKPYSSGEIAMDVMKGVVASAGAGVAAASGNIPGTIGGIIIGTEKFLDAANKYSENLEYEESEGDEEYETYE